MAGHSSKLHQQTWGGLTLMLLAILAVSNEGLWADGAVMVLNPMGVLEVSLVVDGNSVKVDTPIMTLDVTWAGSQNISVGLPDGNSMDVAIKDGDVVLLMPDFTGDGGGIAIHINGGGNINAGGNN